MSANTTPIFTGTVVQAALALTSATTTTAQTLIAAGTNGTRLDNITLTTTDTASNWYTLSLLISGVSYPIGQVYVSAGSGTNSSMPAVNLLQILLGGPSMYLAYGTTLQVAPATTITSAKTTYVTCNGGTF